jgi:hypothetical protein
VVRQLHVVIALSSVTDSQHAWLFWVGGSGNASLTILVCTGLIAGLS